MTHNYLKLNSSKTEIIELHSQYSRSEPIDMFTLDSYQISPSNSAKNLGFVFDKHLNLHDQINNISKICYMNQRNLNRIGSKLSKELKVQLVHSCIHSILDNGNSTFAALSQDKLTKLQKIQNAAVWFIYGLKGKERYQSLTPFLMELHFLPVRYRILYKIALLVFKCLNNLAPKYLGSLIEVRTNNCYSVRLDNDFFKLVHPPSPRTTKTEAAFSYTAPKTWNDLPFSLRSMTEQSAFKKALKTHYFKSAFQETIDQQSDILFMDNFE